ncbi:MAG: hypothetical protein HKN22_00510, partial [Bacteroidia bacterium]|nr:hypothetical protein [Bacteroidia bacterium]
MIKFFRKIRQRLLTENKFSKYLLYAIGEIALVVIGILIALQLNDWNDQQKQLTLEKEYYCRLLDDARLDEEQIQNLLHLAEDRLKASNTAVRLLLDHNSKKIDIATHISLSTKAIYSDFEPNNSAYEDLKSGANLNIISDKSVIKVLNRYFNKVEELKSIIMINGQHAVDISFAHNDYFANGSVKASILGGRFKTGLDEDLKIIIGSKEDDALTSDMRTRLLNESLEFVGANTR